MRAHVSFTVLVASISVSLAASDAAAFCGFYVAKADAKLFNEASQVVMVRDEDKTVLTMVNDFQGSVKEFAVVVPVPTPITREQIHIGDKKVVEHLDQFTSVRLVEYFDPDPCAPQREERMERKRMSSAAPTKDDAGKGRADALGVTIEAQYTVGEYDILILAAKQSDGLQTWLKEEGYKIPDGATEVLASYIKQKMKFFVAKVNLKEHDKLGGGTLRPIQVAYESSKFMLPIRLGTVNSKGTQDLIAYMITKGGRVESTNYRTVKLPSDVNVPSYTKDVFNDFYKAMFANTVKKYEMKAVITEYAWDMSWCDPCAAEPLSSEELRALGVWWVSADANAGNSRGRRGGGGGQNAFVTRLHVRYDRDHFPEDLVFQTTNDRSNFQGRYIMQHAFKGELQCDEAPSYVKRVWDRQQKEATTLADLTGWALVDVKSKMGLTEQPPEIKGKKWYDKLWK